MSSSPGIAASGFPPLAFLLPTPQLAVALPPRAVPSPTGNSTSAPTLPSFADIVRDLTQSDLTQSDLTQSDLVQSDLAQSDLVQSDLAQHNGLSPPLESDAVWTKTGGAEPSSRPPALGGTSLAIRDLPGSLVPLKNGLASRPLAERRAHKEDDAVPVVPNPPQPVTIAFDVQRPRLPESIGDHTFSGGESSVGTSLDTRVGLPDAPREFDPVRPDDTVFQIRLRLGSQQTVASFLETDVQKPSAPTEPGSAPAQPRQPSRGSVQGPETTDQVRLPSSAEGAVAGEFVVYRPSGPMKPGSAAARPESPSETPIRGSATTQQNRSATSPVGNAREEGASQRGDTSESDSDGRIPSPRPGNSGRNRLTGPLAPAIEAQPLAVVTRAVPATQALPAGTVFSAEPPRGPTPPLAPAQVAAPARAQEPDVPHPQPQQQVRSMALEFTPDGGRDVRLRVVERGGEVHVSVHSTDTGLTGRLQDGVQDLAGALASAGYDAEAWTPRDEQRRHQQEPPPELAPAKSQSAAPGEEFAGIFNNPPQETR